MIKVEHGTQQFAQSVDLWTSSAIKLGARDINSLLAVLPSVYPDEVVASVRRLATNYEISRDVEKGILTSLRKFRGSTGGGSLFGLPVPHPLDFDWRFTQQTVEDLLGIALEYGRNLVCLGTPSVFAAADKSASFTTLSLIDSNRDITRHLRHSDAKVYCCDVLSELPPKLLADVVVVDPPWYTEHFRAFLWAASAMCRLGTRVLLCLPAKGTRPGVPEEIEDIIGWADQLGFSIAGIKTDQISYATPHYETNALRAVGISLANPSWRKGTLCVLEKEFATRVNHPTLHSLPFDEWSRATLLGTRFFCRKKRKVGYDDPTLIPILDGDILPSVSRTHPLRKSVDVWTSGNRVFTCHSPRLLHEIVCSLANEKDVHNSLGIGRRRWRVGLVDEVAQAVHALARIERDERRLIGSG